MTAIPAPATHAGGESLDAYLTAWAGGDADRATVAQCVAVLAQAGAAIADAVLLGPLQGSLGAQIGAANADGDQQRALDVIADQKIIAALQQADVAYYASEEEEAILTLKAGGALAVAVDPLDGSSNIDANISVGTIFSIFRASPEGATESFFRPGHEQVAGGYVVYGPHVALVFTLCEGVAHFVLDPADKTFKLIGDGLKIAPTTREYAINASNYRHWIPPIRTFIDDCVAGASGPHGKDFNMRWVASLVAETHRIFVRGGVFLYPADERKGYEHGRLRLLYEANPIALLAEQAGGGATDGFVRILDKQASTLHQRTPLIFGSAEKVTRIATYYTDTNFERTPSPLFGERGLFHV
ncbi:fructose-bisphosphatase class I [Rhodoblastus sphagnicola]|uniref:Fructose-1,6-bisphosphatase class 1 n=1 Tax=Rhodoblastus sphagnicola TaxID=333368 RepID=A0A2S6MYV1_9HYPH|nr:class 1 fructose-bisphosphatase [Rhodoblastus sphagnicola]MBB4196434.1 fructose-1,6-bisphosphatase I [Rhodoblastus sphagnicola]PPQ27526.1 fructose-bisphosphatase class I [Rhodoblastus sphagnicola]